MLQQCILVTRPGILVPVDLVQWVTLGNRHISSFLRQISQWSHLRKKITLASLAVGQLSVKPQRASHWVSCTVVLWLIGRMTASVLDCLINFRQCETGKLYEQDCANLAVAFQDLSHWNEIVWTRQLAQPSKPTGTKSWSGFTRIHLSHKSLILSDMLYIYINVS